MKEKIEKNWSIILVFILGIALAFYVGRGYESKFVQKLAQEHAQLTALVQNTQKLVVKNGDDNLKNVFRQLGYNIPATLAPKETE